MALTRRLMILSVTTIVFVVIVLLYTFERASTRHKFVSHHSRSCTSGETRLSYVPMSLHENQTDSETHNAIEAMYRRLVVATAFSSNHIKEALDMIGSVQKFLPHSKIIVYDLGLTTKERESVSTFCNVELRRFNFKKHPPHVKALTKYAWKPLLLQDMVNQGYDMILYGDSSLRMKAYNITAALECLLDFPFLDIRVDVHSIISLTHDGMIKYFQFPPSRQCMAQWRTAQGGCWFILVNDLIREKLIAPWVDCALHEECIAPKGAHLWGCKYKKEIARKNGTYAGCHRYDQSALNIILAKNFGLEIWDKVVRMEVTDRIATVKRQVQGTYSVRQYPHCNHTGITE